VIPALLKESWRELVSDVNRLDAAGADTKAWHKVRIEAKRLRYCCDAAQPIFGKPAKELSRQAKRITETLGEHQDAVIAADQLQQIATARGGATVAFTLGLLYAEQVDAATAARKKFWREWEEASRSRYRRWLTK
jgi:CHAD domain-containing protein